MSQAFKLLVLAKQLPKSVDSLLQAHLSKIEVAVAEFTLLEPNNDKVQSQAACLSVQSAHAASLLSSHLDDLASTHKLDVFVLPKNFEVPKLAVFDMDSTLIATEVIDELAVKAGIGDKIKAITEQAMRGEIDFKQSFTQRMALLEDLDTQVLEGIKQNLPIMDGAPALFECLTTQHCYSAILSGGFTYFANHLQERLSINEVHANVLDAQNNKLTGKVIEPVIDAHAKADTLKQLAEKQNFHLSQTMAVGDGANDLLMLDAAGLGVAFHAKPAVQKQAEFKLNHNGLDALSYLYQL